MSSMRPKIIKNKTIICLAKTHLSMGKTQLSLGRTHLCMAKTFWDVPGPLPAPSPELSTSCEVLRPTIEKFLLHYSINCFQNYYCNFSFFRLRRYVFSANRRSSNHLIDAPNGRIDQMTPWHFFRFLAARYALPPKIEKNALKKNYEKNALAWPTARAADGLGVGKY